MDEIECTADGITLKESVTVLGETRVEEITIDYDDCSGYEINLSTGGFVSLEDLIDVEYDGTGGIKTLQVTLGKVPSIESEVRTLNSEPDPDEPPEVPRVNLDDIGIEARKNFYRRLRDQPDSQPADIRRIIYSEGDLTRRELDRLIEEAGYASSGGGVSQSLVVLEKVTEEIERRGQGEDQQITWVGDK